MKKVYLKKKKFNMNMTAYDQVKEELKVLKRMEHPNVIFLYEVIDDPNHENMYLVTDFHSSGSLRDKLH